MYLQKEKVIDDSGMQTKCFSVEFPKEGPRVLKINLGDQQCISVPDPIHTKTGSHPLSAQTPPDPALEKALGQGRRHVV